MAHTIASLSALVYDITKRPDLEAETKLAIKTATQKAHNSDHYPRDLVETGITWATPSYLQSLNYSQTFPYFKSLSYLRKYNNSEAGKMFEILTPLEILDRYGRERKDVCYLAGSNIEIKSSSQDTQMLIGYYSRPNTTESGYSSWIADEFESVILLESAAFVFKSIGFDEQASTFNKLYLESLFELKTNALNLRGY